MEVFHGRAKRGAGFIRFALLCKSAPERQVGAADVARQGSRLGGCLQQGQGACGVSRCLASMSELELETGPADEQGWQQAGALPPGFDRGFGDGGRLIRELQRRLEVTARPGHERVLGGQ